MKTKTIKKILIPVAVCAMASCAFGGVALMEMYDKVNAATVTEYYTLDGFTIQETASVRKTEPNGIRFTTTLSAATKGKIEDLVNNPTYGTLLIPADFLSSGELTHSTTGVQVSVAEKWQNDYTYTGVLAGKDNGDGTFTNLSESYYNRPIAARAYVTGTDNDGNTVTYYSENTAVRSIGYVAYMAQQDGEESDLLDQIVATVNMELVFNDELSAYKSATEGTALIYNTYSNSSDKVAALKIGGIVDNTGESVITYSSSDENIISVNGETLTAVGVGEATITASCEINGVTKTIQKTLSTDRYLVKSDYKILVPASASTYETKAAEKLQSVLAEATGVTLEIVTETGNETTAGNYISVGETTLAKDTSAVSVSDLVKTTASRVKTVGNTVFVRGASDRATLYGVQELLGETVGYEFFLEDTYAVDENTEFIVADKDYIPDIEYTLSEYHEESLGIIDDYAMRQVYNGVIPVGGDYAHNSLLVLPYDTYKSSHSDWYYTTGLVPKTVRELCYTAHGDDAQRNAMLAQVATELADAILAEEDKSINRVGFSHADHHMWCTCSHCSDEGNPSDNILHFLLDVVPLVKTKLGDDPRADNFKISTVFYHKTNTPPKNMANYATQDTMKHIEIWFAETGADYVDALDNTDSTNNWNENVYANLHTWANIADTYGCDLLLWTYYSPTTSFFIPYNSFDAIRGNYAIAKSFGVDYVFNQTMGAQTNWTRLKQFLISELAWNANITNDAEWMAMIDSYFAGAYGAGATAMKSYFTAWDTYTERIANEYRRSYDYTTDEGGDNDADDPASISFDTRTATNFPVATLEEWIGYCDAAIAALDSSDSNYEIYYKNILLEKMAPLHLMMYIHGGYNGSLFSTTSYVTTYGAAFLECFNAWDSEVFIDGENNSASIDTFVAAVKNIVGGSTMITVSDKQTVIVGNSVTFTNENLATGTYTVKATSGSESHTYSVTVSEVGVATLALDGLTAGKTYIVSFVASGINVKYINVFAISGYVSSAEDLADVSNTTNGYYILTKDIDCTDVTLGNTFAGTLDGNGYTVSNYGDSEFLPNATKKNLNLAEKATQKIDFDFYVSEGDTSVWLVNSLFKKNDNYTVTVNGVSVNTTVYVEGKLRIAFDSAQLGDTYEVVCYNKTSGISYAFSGICASVVLYADDAANFKTILAENANGYIVLSEDIDFGGAKLAGEIEFSGTLDGRGYSLKNFELNDGGIGETYLFMENSGTIKNISIQYVLGTASQNSTINSDGRNLTGLIRKNTGMVENAKFDVTYNNYGWDTGAIAGANAGTIQNCVVVIRLGTITEKSRIGVAGCDDNGTYKNNYIVHNGILDGREGNAILYAETFGDGTYKNNYAYSTMAELAAAADLSSANGWCEYWSIENETVLFGGRAERVVQENIELDFVLAEDYSGNIVITLPDSISLEGNVSVTFGEIAMTVVSVEGNVLTLEKNIDIAYGNYTITIDATNVLCTIASVDYYTKVFECSDAENFVSLLAATPDGHFVLGEDIDFNGAKLAGEIEFSGTLDGRGYALKNFEINYAVSDGTDGVWESYLIEKNTGMIKNLSIDYVLGTASSDQNAFIAHNEGIIENVKVSVIFKAYGWITAPLAGTNKGTIKNVVIVMDKTDDFTELTRIGGIVGSDYNGTMQNCYVVHNGIMTGAEDRMYLETWNYGTKENCTSYATMAELAAAANFSEENGWSDAWKVVGDIVLFGNEKFEFTIESVVMVASDSNIIITLPENITLSEVEGVSFGATVVNVVSVNGNVLTVENGALAYGEYDVTINVVGGTYILNNAVYCTKVLYASDTANFKTILSENASGYIVLGDDLDFGGAKLAGALTFSGTLDGRGYALKNFVIHHEGSTETEGWNAYLFATNSGTIKNLEIQYTLDSSNTTEASIIKENTGTIENVMVTVTFTTYAWYTAPVAAYSSGTIRNVVVVMDKTDAFTELSRIGGLIGTHRNGTIDNCYVVHNGILSGAESRMNLDAFGGVTSPSNCVAYSTMAELAAAADFSANGWNEYWSIKDSNVIFGYEQETATLDSALAEDYSGNIVLTLPEEISLSNLYSVSFGSTAMTVVSVNGNEITLEKNANIAYGNYTVTISTKQTLYTVTSVNYYTKVLVNSDVENFVSLLAATPDGHFVLGSDIDFNGAKLAGQITFSGTLDGKGYALKNFELNDGGIGETYLFMENSGTIKNISIQYVLGTASENSMVNSDGRNLTGLIRKNTGIVENAKFDVTYNNYGWDTGAIAGANAGTIQNCVVVIRLGTITEKSRIGVAGCDDNGTYKNNYIVHNGILDGREGNAILYAETFGNGTYESNYAYATMAELATAADLSSANGWCEYWSIENNEVLLGDE